MTEFQCNYCREWFFAQYSREFCSSDCFEAQYKKVTEQRKQEQEEKEK